MRDGGDAGDTGHESGDAGSLTGSSFTITGESDSLERPVVVLSGMHGKHSFSISAAQNCYPNNFMQDQIISYIIQMQPKMAVFRDIALCHLV
jgi:hypothetical protein